MHPPPSLTSRGHGLRSATAVALLVGCTILIPLRAQENEVAAVSSKVADDYVRAKRPDGTFEPETYTFGPGGHWAGTSANPSIDKLTLLDIGHVIAKPLATQYYVPSFDPKTTKLLIMVYWGTTRPAEHSSSSAGMLQGQQASATLATAAAAARSPTAGFAEKEAREDAEGQLNNAVLQIRMENLIRDRENAANSKILGYDSWWSSTNFAVGSKLGAPALRHQDLIDELEDPRYFVILMAYDFQMMWKEKKTKLLWETRFSIRERHNEFDRQLAAMAQQAAGLFGQDSHGLLHKPLPNVRVNLGETKVIGTEPAK